MTEGESRGPGPHSRDPAPVHDPSPRPEGAALVSSGSDHLPGVRGELRPVPRPEARLEPRAEPRAEPLTEPLTEPLAESRAGDRSGLGGPRHTPRFRRTYPLDWLMMRASAIVVLLCAPLIVVIINRGLPGPVGQTPLTLWIGGLGLVAAFVACELVPFRIEVRRETMILSLSELPLALGLMLLPAWLAVAAHFVSGFAVYLFRRDPLRHSITNTVMTLLESVLAVSAMQLVGQLTHQPPNAMLPVAVGVLLGALGSGAVIGTILHLVGPAEPYRVMLTRTAVAAATLISFALVIRTVWVSGSSGPVLALVLLGFMAVLFRAFRTLMGNKDDMAAMYAFVQSVATMQTKSARWPEMLELIRDNQNASLAIIYLDTGEDMLASQAVDAEGSVTVPPMPVNDPILIQAAELGVARVSDHRKHRIALMESLSARGSRDMMVVALRADHRIRGYVEVRDRRSRWGRFTDRDMRSLETLSGHVATALDNVRLVEKLREEAHHDAVTGLRNQVGLSVDIDEALRAGRIGAVALIRLGMLSTINGAIGYDRGNELLRNVGERLRASSQPPRQVARMEGDLFAVVIEPMPEEEIVGTVSCMLDALAEQFSLDGVDVEPDPSAGIALNERLQKQRSGDPASFEQRAEMALNAAQKRGEPYAVYRSSMGDLFRRRFQLVTQFRTAVETGQIVVYYQPKVSLRNNQLVGVEALVRWVHPEFGMVSPAEFVPAIEATGFVQLLLSHALDTVLGQIREWSQHGLHIPVAVNLSVRNLTEDFPEIVREALTERAVTPDLLSFEVTESSVMDDPEAALPILHALHDLGIKLSIDDFGTGYSSLAYLRKLPIDEIKIDRSFVWGMSTGTSDLAIVQSIIDLGHSLGKQVVAEGVEEETSREALKAMNCDIMQGFLLSRPLPANRFEEWITARMIRTSAVGAEPPALRLV